MATRNISAIGFWILLALLGGSLSIKITNFDVPSYIVIDDDTPENLVLDCEYELDKTEQLSVLKWFKDETIIYQWIPSSRKPQPFREMRNQIDSTYEASTDETQKYRAISIKNPYWNNTGRYKCMVLTNQGSASQDGHLQVIDISNYTMETSQKESGNETEVKCSVQNIYPMPRLSLWSTDDERIYIRSNDIILNDSGFYNSVAVGVLGVSQSQSGDFFKCSLNIRGTNFSISTTSESRSPGLNSISPALLLVMIAFSIFLLFK